MYGPEGEGFIHFSQFRKDMKMRFQPFRLISLLLIVTMLFSACGAPATAPATQAPVATEEKTAEPATEEPTATAVPATPTPAGPVSLGIVWWGSQTRHDRTIQVLDMYKAANSNIDMPYEFSSWGDYWTLMNTKAAGGQMPCIMQQDYAYMEEWVSRGLLIPLDEYIKSGVIDVTDIPENYLTGGNLDGKQYGVTLGVNSQAFVLDTDAFGKAGVDLPAADWTWKDFEDISLKLHEKLGVWAMGVDLDAESMWKSLYLGHGQWVFSEDNSKIAYTDDQPFIDYFNMILRLQKAGAIPNAEEAVEFKDLGPEVQPIITSRAVMDYRWSNQLSAVMKAAGDGRNFKLWPLPRPEGGKSENYIKPSMFFAITSSCENPEEAAKFINYFINSIEANEVLLAERGVPGPAKVREALLPKLDAAQSETFAFIDLISADSQPVPPADPKGWGDIRANVYKAQFSDPVLYGQITLEEGLKILRTEVDKILAENAKP